MPEDDIEYCHACGSAMDVSAVEPFANVECPECKKHTRVKTEFGVYTLSRRHAIGGMSMVFVAQDTMLDREVVVKILSEEYSADEKRITSFEEEARITASVNHPNVVQVFATGHAYGRFFIAMEFLSGGHFEHHINERGRIPESEAVDIALDVAAGLMAVKDSGLIHRDVKPGNILLDGSGNAKIVDFGLALVTQEGKAKASEIWATPYYVPPEAIEGKEEDFRSDMYAFGATMYHALAGKPPCDEQSMDTKRLREVKQAIRPLSEVAVGVNDALCKVIDRCMKYDASKRYGTYRELIDDLKKSKKKISGEFDDDGGKGDLEESRRRSLSGRLALPATIAALIVAVILGVTFFGGDEEEEEGAAPVVEVSESVEEVQSDPVDEDKVVEVVEVNEASKLYRMAQEALDQGNFSQAKNRFEEVRDHANVLEPTGSWAALEAVVASYLMGDGPAAKKSLNAASNHFKGATQLDAEMRVAFGELVKRARGYAAIRPPSVFEGGPEAPLIWLISGLKNWDEGSWDAALPFFQELGQANLDGEWAWARPYRKVAQHYLADYQRLDSEVMIPADASKSQLEEQLQELGLIYPLLETKGRARFNLRCRQLELERRVRSAEELVVEVEPEPVAIVNTEFPQEVPQLLQDGHYQNAIDLLKAWNPQTDEDKQLLESYLSLAQSAQSFLATLGERVGESEVEMPISSRDGRVFAKVVSGSAQGLVLLEAEGQVVELPWQAISADDLVGLHREMMKRTSVSEMDQVRAYEQAVSFDFLSGNRQRALAAAARLGESSDLFRERWKSLVSPLESVASGDVGLPE